MNFQANSLPGVVHISHKRFEDNRGSFVKTYSHKLFSENDALTDLKEEFYSSSKKGVLRGMHFQTPPHDHAKVAYCPLGSVLDVLLDLRQGLTYGKTTSFLLTAANPSTLIIPKGIAHGFLSLEENSIMVYKTTTDYASSHDAGIKWDSFGFDWKLEGNPILSKRDANHSSFSDFVSPFTT